MKLDANAHVAARTVRAYGLSHNVICIKQLLSEREQMDVVHLSHDLSPSNLLEASPFPQHTPWIYHNWPSKFMEKGDAEKAIESDEEKEKRMGLLLSLGGIIGKMIISIAKAANNQMKAPQPVPVPVPAVLEMKEEEEQKNGNDIVIQHHPLEMKDDGQSENPHHGAGAVGGPHGKKQVVDIQNENDDRGYAPKAIYGILYPPRGFLEAHTDAHQGWVVSISVGSDCDFWYKNGVDDERKHRVNIESGDVMVFPGYRLMHGVDAVGEGVPRFWKLLQAEHVVPVQFSRYCLQFRHPMN